MAGGCATMPVKTAWSVRLRMAMPNDVNLMNSKKSIPSARILAAAACFAALAIPAATVDHVIQVSLDGLGGIYLQEYVTTTPEEFPNFVRLMEQGAYTFNARCDYDYSETVPNHVTMFTARPVSQPEGFPDTSHHGYDSNFPGGGDTIHANGNPNVAYKASMFDVAHDHGLSTAFHASKTRLEICNRSYNEFNGALDLTGEDNGRDKIDAAFVTNTSGDSITNEVNVLIEDLLGESPTRYSFIHIAEPDLTGHGTGWGSASWRNIVRLVDAQLGRILDAIETQPALQGNTALIITADHGGGGVNPSGHTEAFHILNYTIPFFLVAPGVPGGSDLYSLLGNRGDPGTNRTDYTTVPQPIRDGDASNLALALLGLPPIPDSFMIPDYLGGGVTLTTALTNGFLQISWSDSTSSFRLERSDSIDSSAVWTRIDSGIASDGIDHTYQADLATGGSSGFFRLRGLGFSVSRQPESQLLHAGTSAQLSVETMSDTELTFQWFKDGAPLDGATNAQLELGLIEAADAGDYWVEIGDGEDTIVSATATVTVLFNPVITRQPESQAVTQGATVQFEVEAEGAPPLGYQWRKDGIDLSEATETTLTITNVTLAEQGAYTVVVTDQNGSATSDPAQLDVIVPLLILEPPQSVTNQVGATVTFSVTVQGNPPPFTYVWRKFPSMTFAPIVTDERTSTLTLTNIQPSDASIYIVNISNETNPTGVTTSLNTRLVVVEP